MYIYFGVICVILSFIGGGFDIWQVLAALLSAAAVIFLTLPVHEFAHGFIADKLGDPTPRRQGRLTLNPLAHLDPIGSLGILLFGIGWAKPVGINARYFRNPKRDMALTALAGPVSNVIMAFIVLFLTNLVFFFAKDGEIGSVTAFIIIAMYYIANINVYLAVFNFIPVPPFDGSRVLFAFLPTRYYFAIMRYERYIFIGILILLYTRVLDYPLSVASNYIMSRLSYLSGLPFGVSVFNHII